MPPTTRRKAKPAPEPVEEVEELEEVEDELEDAEVEDTDEDDDLAELEDEEDEEESAPEPVKAKKSTKKAATTTAKAATSGNDSNWLAQHVTETTGKEVDARGIRVLLRKLAKDGTLAREVGVDRTRYDFPAGAKDPTVVAVIKAVKGGALERAKSDGLEKARQAKEAKKQAAAAEAEAAAKPPAKAAKAPAKATKAAPATRRKSTAKA